MPRFFFHLRDGDNSTQDLWGADFLNVEAARAEATIAARACLAEGLRTDGVLRRGYFEIRDEIGNVCAVVPLRDTLTL